MVFLFILFAIRLGRDVLFLEDFVVKQDYRGQGVGAQLFEETIRIAQQLRVKGMVWQVLVGMKMPYVFIKNMRQQYIQNG